MTSADLERLIASGESESLEFKETTGQRTEAARSLSAMLNGQGGAVVFGVARNGAIRGQQVTDKTLEDITNVCLEIQPRLPPRIERVPVPDNEGLALVVVSVPQGNSKPYAFKGSYYVRSGATTVSMPDELQLSLVLERAHGFDRWELADADRAVSDLDEAEIAAFRDDAIATNRAPFDRSASAADVLRAIGALDDQPNRAAVALFGRRDRLGGEYQMLGCHLVAVEGRELGESFIDEQMVDAHAFEVIRATLEFMRRHLEHRVEISGVKADVELEVPILALREAIANAVSHRDYIISGRIQVRVYEDRIEVVSPGGLHFGLTPVDLYAPHTSYPWNPLVAGALYRRGIVDQLGSGTVRMVRECAKHEIGRPVFISTGSSVSCCIPRRGRWLDAAGQSMDLSDADVRMLHLLFKGPASRGDVAKQLGLSDLRARDALMRLQALGVTQTAGTGRGARWALAPPQNQTPIGPPSRPGT